MLNKEQIDALLEQALSGAETKITVTTSGNKTITTTTIQRTPQSAIKSLLLADILSGGEIGIFAARAQLKSSDPMEHVKRPKRIGINSKNVITNE